LLESVRRPLAACRGKVLLEDSLRRPVLTDKL